MRTNRLNWFVQLVQRNRWLCRFLRFISHGIEKRAGWHTVLFYGIIIINIRCGTLRLAKLCIPLRGLGMCPSHLQLRFSKAEFISKTNDPTIVIVHGRLRYAQCQKYVACLVNLINLIILLFNNTSKCTQQLPLTLTLHSKTHRTRWLFTRECILIKYNVLIIRYTLTSILWHFVVYFRCRRIKTNWFTFIALCAKVIFWLWCQQNQWCALPREHTLNANRLLWSWNNNLLN